MKFKKSSIRNKIETQIDDLADQAKDLVDRAPGLRDQVKDRLPDRDELKGMMPDRQQLLDLRDDLFEKLPEGVGDRIPEKAKPRKKRGKLKKVALFGVVTGAGAAAFAALRRLGGTPAPSYTQPRPAPTTPAKAPPVPPMSTSTPATKAAPAKKAAAEQTAPGMEAPPAKKIT